jgi:membrane protein implicated in regulation of membrane protease activity
MDPETFVQVTWIFWLALILVFGVIEIFTLDFIFLMLATGSVGGLVLSLFHAPLWTDILVAALLSIVLIFFVRPPLLHRLQRGGDKRPTNVEALLGLHATVVTPFVDGAGQAKLANGETWSARVVPAATEYDLQPGAKLVVVGIEGATAVVEPAVATTI